MKHCSSLKEFEERSGISVEDALSIFESLSEAFPMIVSANLTQNTYTMIKDEGFLAGDFPTSGRYDDLIDHGVLYIHPNYQKAFLDRFSRENLMKKLQQGQKEVYAKLYQKGQNDNYQWVSTHVIRVQDQNGDICQICLNKVLCNCCVDERPRFCGAPH